jgi:proteasome lid subunit RPN8/RPN11
LIGTTQAILEAVPVENAAVDPFRRYEIPPEAYVAQLKRCREQGGAVVGAYHSHPRSLPEPSPTDLEMAFAEFIFLIAGQPAAGTNLELRAWVLRDQEMAEIGLTVL